MGIYLCEIYPCRTLSGKLHAGVIQTIYFLPAAVLKPAVIFEVHSLHH